MKRILALVLAMALALTVAMPVFAADETQIPLDADHLDLITAEEAVIADGSITVNEINQFAFLLPEVVPIDGTVVIHIKGSSDSDFRAWLLGAGSSEEKGSAATFSNQWRATENGFTAPGEFEKYIELIAEDFDAQGFTEANRVNFKAPSYDSNLENFTLSYLGVIYGPMSEVEGDAAAEAQPFADAAAAALAAAQAANGDEAAVNAALSDAEAAVAALEEKAALGFPAVNDLLKAAKDSVKEINSIINSAAEEAAVEAISADVAAVADALASAQAAGEDIDAINAALAEAQASPDDYDAVKADVSPANSRAAMRSSSHHSSST